MTNISEKNLQEYYTEAEYLVEHGSLDAAIAIGQHILRHYPKHVNAYRVLAMATLEQGELGYSADLFKRVLSADPENLEARVGLGIIYTDEQAMEEALWQWERALELAPGDSNIQTQLRQVREQLEGSELPRIELTRGALGRLYSRGGLFKQAAEEFRAVLRKDPEQVDIQVSLAETLWRDGKLAEAEAICEQVVEALPNCLKANLILGHIWLHTGREEESHKLFRVAQALDPENHVAVDLLGEESPLAREPVFIPQLDELPPETPKPEDLIPVVEKAGPEEPVVEAELPDWLTQLRSAGIEEEEPEEETVEEAELPDWLTTLEPTEAEEPVAQMAAIETPSPESMSEFEDEDLPDWLVEAGEEEPTEAPFTAEPEAEELPDWLVELGGEEPTEESFTDEALVPESPIAEEEDIPHWLATLEQEGAREPLTEAELTEQPEIQEEGEPFAEEPVAAEEADRDVPDWLAQLRTEMDQEITGVEETGIPSPAEDADRFASRDVPEWLQDASTESALSIDAISEEEVLTSPAESAETPDWLTALEAEEPITPEGLPQEAEPAEEIADWLTGLQADEAAQVAEAPPAPADEAAEPAEREEEPADWLAALEGLTEEEEGVEEAPDWLTALEAEEPAVPQTAETPAEPEEADIERWREVLREEGLEEMIQTVPAEVEGLPQEAEPAEEIPDWLAALQPEEPVVPEAEAPVEPEEADIERWREVLREEGLEEMIQTVPAEVEGLPQEAEPAEEVPDWLAALQAEEGIVPEEAEVSTEPEIAQVVAAAETPPKAERAEEIPDWLAALQTEEAIEPEVAEVAFEADEPIEPVREREPIADAALSGISFEAGIVDFEAIAEEAKEAEAEPASEEAIPGWLTGWRKEAELEETEVEMAVEGEGEAEVEEEIAAEVAAPETPLEEAAREPEEEEEPASFLVSSYHSRLATHPNDHQVRLALARAYRDEKKPSKALEQFEALVASGRLVKELLPDLEGLCASYPDEARWHQLLGDAYVRTNRLEDALSAYRAAQNALSRS